MDIKFENIVSKNKNLKAELGADVANDQKPDTLCIFQTAVELLKNKPKDKTL